MRHIRKTFLAVALALSMLDFGPFAAPAHAQSIITCTTSIDNPHQSGHVPGSVNVVAHVVCTAPMSLITLSVNLYWNNNFLRATNSCSKGGSSFLNCNAAAVTCLPGVYQGKATAGLYFPPGYEPSPQFANVQSPIVAISCT